MRAPIRFIFAVAALALLSSGCSGFLVLVEDDGYYDGPVCGICYGHHYDCHHDVIVVVEETIVVPDPIRPPPPPRAFKDKYKQEKRPVVRDRGSKERGQKDADRDKREVKKPVRKDPKAPARDPKKRAKPSRR